MSMKKIKIVRIVLMICIISWAILVFYLSNQQGTESSGLSQKIASFLVHQEEKIEKVEPVIRKLAHFSEYTLGGILFMTLFSTYAWTNKRRIITSILLGVWYAATDEFHQLFVEARSGNIKDVCIDSAGVIFGVFVILIVMKSIQRIAKRKVNCV